MQAVAHCIDYYQHLINNFQPTRHATAWLWDWKHHYEILNARPTIRDQAHYDSLTEAGVTPLQHSWDKSHD